MPELELDLTGMTWYGATVTVILTMMAFIRENLKRQRFNPEEYTNSEITRMVGEAIHSERDRAIILRRLIDGICFEPLAEEFLISVPQVKRIVYKAETALSRMVRN